MAVELVLLEDKPDPNPISQFFTGALNVGTNLINLGISSTIQTGSRLCERTTRLVVPGPGNRFGQ